MSAYGRFLIVKEALSAALLNYLDIILARYLSCKASQATFHVPLSLFFFPRASSPPYQGEIGARAATTPHRPTATTGTPRPSPYM